jgi:hypothetical protein
MGVVMDGRWRRTTLETTIARGTRRRAMAAIGSGRAAAAIC